MHVYSQSTCSDIKILSSQGGNNADRVIVVDSVKYILHLIPW